MSGKLFPNENSWKVVNFHMFVHPKNCYIYIYLFDLVDLVETLVLTCSVLELSLVFRTGNKLKIRYRCFLIRYIVSSQVPLLHDLRLVT